MNALTPHIFEERFVRSFTRDDGEFCFIAKDVCACLGIKNSRDAISVLDKDEAGVVLTDTRSENGVVQKREMSYVTESGLYTLILRSRKAVTQGTAQHRFRRWVTSEVLPSLRQTGRYELPGREAVPDLGPLQEVANKARLVEIALRMKGRAAASVLWDELGLPHLADAAHPGYGAAGAVELALPALRRFFDARLTIRKGSFIAARDLYASYAEWAAEDEAELISEAAFGRGMAQLAPELGFFKAKRRNVIYCDLMFAEVANG